MSPSPRCEVWLPWVEQTLHGIFDQECHYPELCVIRPARIKRVSKRPSLKAVLVYFFVQLQQHREACARKNGVG